MTFFDPVLILARTGAVLGATLLVALLARKNPALRVAAIRWGMVGAVVLAVGSGWWRERSQPVVPVPYSKPFTVSVPVSEGPVSVAEVLSKDGPAQPVVMAERTFELSTALAYGWAIGALLLSLQLIVGAVALSRIRRRCQPVISPDLLERTARLSAEAGTAPPRLVEGEIVTGPFVSGLGRATVFLPKGWAQTAEPEAFEAVLRHELAHVANGDLLWGLFGWVVRIALWPQPLLWLVRGLLAAAEEEACDRQVVASGVSNASYAASLLTLREVRSASKVPSLGIGAVSRSGFARRVEAILSFNGKGGIRLSRMGSVAIRSGLLLSAAGAAFVFARPAAVPAAQEDPTKDWFKGPYAMKVRVLDAAGKPVAGAKAALVTYSGFSSLPAKPLSVKGNEIDVPEVAAGEDAQGILAVRAPGHAIGFLHLWPAPKRVTELRLSAPVALTGRLDLPDGRPAAGLKVIVDLLFAREQETGEFLPASLVPDLVPTAVTDASGRFTLGDLPKNTTVAYNVDDDRYARASYPDRGQTGTEKVSTAKPMRLVLGAAVEGRVTRDGKPVAGVVIGAQENHEKSRFGGTEGGDARTDAEGRYRLTRLQASVYNLAVALEGGLDREVTATAHEAIEVKAGERIAGKDFELIPGTLIEGEVTEPDGKPMPKVYVGVYGPAHPKSSAWVQGTKTDSQGRYRFRVPPGKQMVYVSDGRYDAEQKHVTTSEGVTRVNFRVTPKAPVSPSQQAPVSEETVEAPAPKSLRTDVRLTFEKGDPLFGPEKLPNGATVRLAFLQDGTPSNPVWRPDGEAAPQFDQKRALDLGGWSEGADKIRRLFFAMDIQGRRRGSYDVVVQTPDPAARSVWQTYGDRRNRSMDLGSFEVDPRTLTTDVKVGLAAGEYRKTFFGRIGAAPLFARVSKQGKGFPATASATVTFRFPRALEGKNVRLAAYTKGGRQCEVAAFDTETQVYRKTGEGVRAFGYSGVSPEEIERVELLVRDYQWTTFRGVRMYPNR